MRKILFFVLMSYLFVSSVQAQELFTEFQAGVIKDGPPYTFRVLGDKEATTFAAYGILVVAPDGTEQMIDEFDSLLPEGSEADALYVEDLNFDGYADLRIMQYLPGGANVPYYFWLYDKDTEKFKQATAFEVILSPEVNAAEKMLISRQRSSAAEYSSEFYKPQGDIPVLVRREERTYNPDGSSLLKVFEVKDNSGLQLIETKTLPVEK